MQTVELLQAELPTDDRGDGQRLVASLGQAVQASADHLAHALGNPDFPADGLAAAGLRQHALFLEQADDLGEEERIALALCVDGLSHLAGQRHAGRGVDEALHILAVEPA